jgi:hypothetical protein
VPGLERQFPESGAQVPPRAADHLDCQGSNHSEEVNR